MSLLSKNLFVYGSLRNGFHSSAYKYISNYFSFVNTGKVRGVIIDLGEYPVGIPSEDESVITGELYRINNEDEFFYAIAQLDDYEGLNGEEDELVLYKREITKVYVDDSTETDAWIYWYIGDTSGKPVMQSEDMMNYYKEKSNN